MQGPPGAHDTPLRTLELTDAGFGLGAIDHAVPFHDSISVLATGEALWYWPTAVQAVADTQDTPENWLLALALFGLGAIDHAVPFHDSTSVFVPALVE